MELVQRQLKHSTLNNHSVALRRVFKVAIDRGWIHAYQVPELKNKETKSKRRSNFTIREYFKIVRFMRSCPQAGRTKKVQMMRELLRDYISILVNTGMRHGTETYNLKWKNIKPINHRPFLFMNLGES